MDIYKQKNIFWCTKCVVASTRPRVTFNKEGVCSACQWAEEKKKLKVESEEVDAKDMANTLAKNVDYLKALKIHEAKLTKKLKKVLKERQKLRKAL